MSRKQIQYLYMRGYIYKHTSPSGKSYIGQTIKKLPEKRWGIGGKNYFRGNSTNHKFERAIKKYGWENFTHEILEVVGVEDKQELLDKLNSLEEYYIKKFDTFNNGYNSTTGGGNRILCKETKKKLSIANLGKPAWNKGLPMSEETRRKISISSAKGKIGKRVSDKTRQKMRIAKIGYIPWNKGLKLGPMPEEHRLKLIGRKLSEETLEKYKNRKQSQITKQKISKALKGRPGYWLGKKRSGLSNKNKKWFNNNILSIMAYECPEGFKPGRLKWK